MRCEQLLIVHLSLIRHCRHNGLDTCVLVSSNDFSQCFLDLKVRNHFATNFREALTEIIAADEDAGIKAVVTAVPDERKGERLVIVHTAIEQSIDELRSGLTERGLPNLYIPSADSFWRLMKYPSWELANSTSKVLRKSLWKSLAMPENSGEGLVVERSP